MLHHPSLAQLPLIFPHFILFYIKPQAVCTEHEIGREIFALFIDANIERHNENSIDIY